MTDGCGKNKLRVGIVGCGRITETRHAPEYAACENAEIIGYFDFKEERAAALAERFGGRVFSSAEELLACPEIDAVSVCTANATHAAVTVAALRAGKHVLCEKPMATTLSECREMLAVAKESGKRLALAHNQRMNTAHRTARELLSSGAIGRPLTFKSCFGHSGPDNWSVDAGTGNWFFDKARSAFGAVADLGIHKIDLVRFLLGSEIEAVDAMLGTLDKCYSDGTPVSVDDNAVILCRMRNGVRGAVTVSWTYYAEEENDTTVYGTEGRMQIDPAAGCITLTKKGGVTERILVPQGTTTGVIDAFVSSVLDGTPCDLDAEVLFPSMQAMMAAIECDAEGKRMTL